MARREFDKILKTDKFSRPPPCPDRQDSTQVNTHTLLVSVRTEKGAKGPGIEDRRNDIRRALCTASDGKKLDSGETYWRKKAEDAGVKVLALKEELEETKQSERELASLIEGHRLTAAHHEREAKSWHDQRRALQKEISNLLTENAGLQEQVDIAETRVESVSSLAKNISEEISAIQHLFSALAQSPASNCESQVDAIKHVGKNGYSRHAPGLPNKMQSPTTKFHPQVAEMERMSSLLHDESSVGLLYSVQLGSELDHCFHFCECALSALFKSAKVVSSMAMAHSVSRAKLQALTSEKARLESALGSALEAVDARETQLSASLEMNQSIQAEFDRHLKRLSVRQEEQNKNWLEVCRQRDWMHTKIQELQAQLHQHPTAEPDPADGGGATRSALLAGQIKALEQQRDALQSEVETLSRRLDTLGASESASSESRGPLGGRGGTDLSPIARAAKVSSLSINGSRNGHDSSAASDLMFHRDASDSPPPTRALSRHTPGGGGGRDDGPLDERDLISESSERDRDQHSVGFDLHLTAHEPPPQGHLAHPAAAAAAAVAAAAAANEREAAALGWQKLVLREAARGASELLTDLVSILQDEHRRAAAASSASSAGGGGVQSAQGGGHGALRAAEAAVAALSCGVGACAEAVESQVLDLEVVLRAVRQAVRDFRGAAVLRALAEERAARRRVEETAAALRVEASAKEARVAAVLMENRSLVDAAQRRQQAAAAERRGLERQLEAVRAERAAATAAAAARIEAMHAAVIELTEQGERADATLAMEVRQRDQVIEDMKRYLIAEIDVMKETMAHIKDQAALAGPIAPSPDPNVPGAWSPAWGVVAAVAGDHDDDSDEAAAAGGVREAIMSESEQGHVHPSTADDAGGGGGGSGAGGAAAVRSPSGGAKRRELPPPLTPGFGHVRPRGVPITMLGGGAVVPAESLPGHAAMLAELRERLEEHEIHYSDCDSDNPSTPSLPSRIRSASRRLTQPSWAATT